MLAYFTWDPNRAIFWMPYLNHPVTWYGLLFATGFFIGYSVLRWLLVRHLELGADKAVATQLADRFAVLLILGAVIGARLGHVFFYDWPYYRTHTAEIWQVWQGGLASHGAAVGILIAIALFWLWQRKKYPTLTFLALLDALVLPASLAGVLIRIGNFINQEILGTPTTLPWGVIFLHPVEGPANVPLHPAQLYESLLYLIVSAWLLFLILKKHVALGWGVLTGWFFLLVFGGRFLIEFVKLPQSEVIHEAGSLNMGQWLSIPFVIVGIILLLTYYRRKK